VYVVYKESTNLAFRIIQRRDSGRKQNCTRHDCFQLFSF
jgi:hypothetical protein